MMALILEVMSSVLVLTNAPLQSWGIPGILYAAYLVVISYALRGRSDLATKR
jgi:hypothetical protein